MQNVNNDPVVLEKKYYDNIVSLMEQMANKVEMQNEKLSELDMENTSLVMERDELQELVNNTMKPISEESQLEKYRLIAKI